MSGASASELDGGRAAARGDRIVGDRGGVADVEIAADFLEADGAAMAAVPRRIVAAAIAHPQKGLRQHPLVLEGEPDPALFRRGRGGPGEGQRAVGDQHPDRLIAVDGRIDGQVDGAAVGAPCLVQIGDGLALGEQRPAMRRHFDRLGRRQRQRPGENASCSGLFGAKHGVVADRQPAAAAGKPCGAGRRPPRPA